MQSYSEFWPHYLREHAKPETRALHYVGTALALGLFACIFIYQDYWFLFAALVCGYLFAWIGHFFVEKNRPATFTYPLWSLVSDFRMFVYWITGRLGPELQKAGVRPPAAQFRLRSGPDLSLFAQPLSTCDRQPRRGQSQCTHRSSTTSTATGSSRPAPRSRT